MPNGQVAVTCIPYPSRWSLYASIGGRPLSTGTLMLNTLTNNRISGTVNYRGNNLPIQGFWNANNQQITFDSPFATYVGTLSFVDEPPIHMRHFTLRGSFQMKPPSIRAGESGIWWATTDILLS